MHAMTLKWMERTESRLERQEESLQAICNHWLPAILSAAAGCQDHATTAGHQQPPLQKTAKQPPPPQSSYAGGPCEAAKRRRAGRHRLSLKRAAEQPVQMPMEQPEQTAAGLEPEGLEVLQLCPSYLQLVLDHLNQEELELPEPHLSILPLGNLQLCFCRVVRAAVHQVNISLDCQHRC